MKWIPLVAIFSAGCASITPPVSPEAPAPTERLTTRLPEGALADLLTAEIALNEGKPELAFDYLQRQATATGDPALLRRAARIGTQAGADNALRSARALVQSAPNDFEAQALLARALLTLEKGTEAAEALIEAARLRPDQPLGFVRALVQGKPALAQTLADGLAQPDTQPLALAVIRLHAAEEATGARAALKLASTLEKRFPKDLGVASELARLSQLTGDLPGAIRVLEKARRHHPDNLGLTQTLAQLLVGEGDYEAAIELFDTLIELADDSAPYRLSQGMLALELERWALATERAESLLDSPDYQDDALGLLGAVAIAEERLDDAREFLSSVQGDGFLGARYRYGLAIAASNRSELDRWYDEALQLRPDLAAPLALSRAELLMDNGHEGAALAHLDEQLNAQPNNTELWYGRAMMRDPSDFAGIEADLLATLDIDPDNAAALNALGYTYADNNVKLEQALDLIGRALAIRPDDAATLDSMGWVQYRLGD
ncbi:MAG: tetratricopeptide repeat protein, partial [Litorivicinus sp.]